MKKPEEADVNELGEIYCEPINSVSVMEMIEIANGSIEAIQTDVQEESQTSDPGETISLSPENQRAGVKPSGKAQFLSIKAQSESTGGGLGSFSDDIDNDNDNENDTGDAGYGKDNDKVENRGTEVVASFNDRKPGSPGSAIASGREMKVLGGEISGSAIAQIANKRRQQVASGESQQEEQEEERREKPTWIRVC